MNNDYQNVVDQLIYLNERSLTYNSSENLNLSIAVQAAEDRQFKKHSGFHIRGILRAIYVYITHRKLQGASTIEQQLVRVIRNRYELSINRKVSEIIIASALNDTFSKDTLLELYMEVAYFGWHGSGISEICNRLDIEPNSLSLKQACLVAALIKMPMPEHPSKNYLARVEKRQKYILEIAKDSEEGKNS